MDVDINGNKVYLFVTVYTKLLSNT